MKQLFYFLLICLAIQQAACQSPAKKQAQKTADAIQDVMKTYDPREVATSESGYSIKETIDGKS